MDYDGLSAEAKELLLCIEHDHAYYKAYFEPMARNLSRRHKRGERLDLMLAIRGFMYGVNGAAKTYRQEHGSMTTPWHKMFPVSDRRAVAERLASYAITEIKLNGGWS